MTTQSRSQRQKQLPLKLLHHQLLLPPLTQRQHLRQRQLLSTSTFSCPRKLQPRQSPLHSQLPPENSRPLLLNSLLHQIRSDQTSTKPYSKNKLQQAAKHPQKQLNLQLKVLNLQL